MKVKSALSGVAFGLMALALPSTLTSCDEQEGKAVVDYSAPASVSGISYEAGPGEVYLSWKIPTGGSHMYSKVVYKNAKGEEVYRLYSKDQADETGMIHATIGGFVTTDPVDFAIYSCSVKGASKDPVVYSAKPGAPAFLAVANTVSVEPDWGCVKVNYSNETVAEVFVNLDYASVADESRGGSVKLTVPAGSTGSQTARLWANELEFLSGEEVRLLITAQDADGNASPETTATVRPKLVKQLDKSKWSVPGFVDSYDAAIGYSSQESGGEGGYPNGRVTAMFDNNPNTFWHTQWKGTATVYPHFFIVDLGEEYENVCAVSVRRRTNNNATHKGHTFWTCTQDAAAGEDPSAWSWKNQGWRSFNPDINDLQVMDLDEIGKARYVKVTFDTSDQGRSQYVMISEFNVYARGE